jgi:hypothetical protein
MDDIMSKLRGWPAPLRDKALSNELVDVEAINVPASITEFKDPGLDSYGVLIPAKPCTTFAYAAYLPPGLHQFLIYIPEVVV